MTSAASSSGPMSHGGSKTEAELRDAVGKLLPAKDPERAKIGAFRAEVEAHMGLAPGALDSQKDVFKQIVEEMLRAPAVSHAEPEEFGEEIANASKSVYLITFPHPTQTHAADGTALKAPSEYSQSEIIDAVVASVRKTDAQRLRALPLELLSDFREKHADGNPHDHVPCKAGRSYRFNPVKKALLHDYGLATHWSCTHDHYASAVRYCYLPSKTKPLAELDPKPVLWAAEGQHPPLVEASKLPVTATALAERREKQTRSRAEKGKAEARFKELDLWPVVVRENIMDGPHAPEILMAYAKRCGGHPMVEFCFKNWDRLPSLITKCWKVEKVEECVESHGKTRMELLTEALSAPCVCGGQWVPCAMELFEKNHIQPADWAAAVIHALEHGRSKGTLVCHAGLHGNEGKSFLYEPLTLVFGEDNVFVLTSKTAFPLLNLERAKLALLDDWRFNEDIVSYPLQLLWFEGKPVVIARPQNQYSGHLKYTRNDPVFITTLESDITSLKHKKLAQGDVDMMLRRLKIFRFHHQVQPRAVPACAYCFACLLLRNGDTTLQGASSIKRPAPGPTGATPNAKRPTLQWGVVEVLSFLDKIELGHVKDAFASNAIDGPMLLQLSDDDMKNELGLTPLQARKIRSRLP